MEKLITGVREFQTQDFPRRKAFYERLAARTQRPEALFITCSDSRVHPNEITSTEPGDLFLVRNAGNVVPPDGGPAGGEIATIEYALAVLNVRHIVICGHSQCGAMQAMLDGNVPDDLPGLKAWLRYLETTRQIVRRKHQNLEGAELLKAATEENVLVQMNHLSTHPQVASRLSMGELHIYGWYYDIGTGQVLEYDQSQGVFRELGDDALAASPLPVRAASA
ncbi:MAG: carbonic anhydrase [Planctomycetes bacterium]|nr:carbonic anhydrase [Planctomycetota bacterium]